MENIPDNASHIEKSPSDSNDSEGNSKKSKKKQAKRIGWMAVSPDKTAAEKKVSPALSRPEIGAQINKDQPTKLNIQEISNESEAPLNAQELELITAELARRRRSEIAREMILTESSRFNSDRDETNAADEFLGLVEVSGDADAAYETVTRSATPNSEAKEELSQSIDKNDSINEDMSDNFDLVNLIPRTAEVPKTENIALNSNGNIPLTPPTLARLNRASELPQASYYEPIPLPASLLKEPSKLRKPLGETLINTELRDQKTNQSRVVASGLSAYLLERRRMRDGSKDMRRPIQNKQEKQIAKVQGDLSAKEVIVRKSASDKSPVERIGERIRAEETYSNPKADSSKISVELPSTSVTRSEQFQPHVNSIKQFSAEKQSLRMSRVELTKVSEKIVIEGVSLQKIYDSHLINDRAQRRIVTVYLRGGNIQKALRRELDVRSVAFEALSVVNAHSAQSESMRDLAMRVTPEAKLKPEKVNQSSDRKKSHKTHPVKRTISLTVNHQSAAVSFVILILLILFILFR